MCGTIFINFRLNTYTLLSRGDGITDDSEISFLNCSHRDTVLSLPSRDVSTIDEDDESDNVISDTSIDGDDVDFGSCIDMGWLLPI